MDRDGLLRAHPGSGRGGPRRAGAAPAKRARLDVLAAGGWARSLPSAWRRGRSCARSYGGSPRTPRRPADRSRSPRPPRRDDLRRRARMAGRRPPRFLIAFMETAAVAVRRSTRPERCRSSAPSRRPRPGGTSRRSRRGRSSGASGFGSWTSASRALAGPLSQSRRGRRLDLWRQVGVATGAGAWERLERGRSPVRPGRTPATARSRWRGCGLLTLLAALLLLAGEDRESDWLALRLQALGLAAASLVLGAMAGPCRRRRGQLAGDGARWAPPAGHRRVGWRPRPARSLLIMGPTPPSSAPPRRPPSILRLGLGSVTVLATTGAYAAWQQVGGVPAFVGTTYGRWLLLKLVLFGALIPLAARNLLVSRRRLSTSGPGTPEAAAALRRNGGSRRRWSRRSSSSWR